MNSNYDINLRVSVPTMEYFKSRTGLDLILEEGNKERAEGKVLSLTAKAKDFLFSTKNYEIQNIFSYLIKTNAEYLRAWENYVVRYIETTFTHGTDENWAKVPMGIVNAIDGSCLSARDFTANIKQEVRYTTVVF